MVFRILVYLDMFVFSKILFKICNCFQYFLNIFCPIPKFLGPLLANEMF